MPVGAMFIQSSDTAQTLNIIDLSQYKPGDYIVLSTKNNLCKDWATQLNLATNEQNHNLIIGPISSSKKTLIYVGKISPCFENATIVSKQPM